MAKKDGTADLRVKRTQKAIKHALLALIEENGFEHITVKDITDKAEISRNTFYLHYEDKYDLTNKMCDELVRKLFFNVGKQLRREQKLTFDTQSAARIMQIAIEIINSDKDEYRILFSCSGSDILEEKLSQTIRKALGLIKDETEGIHDYSVEYIVAGIIGIMKYQVTNNPTNVNSECEYFAAVHLSKIIETIKEHKKRTRQQKI